MQFTMRKKIFRLQANEKSFAAERFHRVDKNGDEYADKMQNEKLDDMMCEACELNFLLDIYLETGKCRHPCVVLP